MYVLGLYISFLVNNVETLSPINPAQSAHPSTPKPDAPRGLLGYLSSLQAHELPDLHHPLGQSITPFSPVSHDRDAGWIFISVRSILMTALWSSGQSLWLQIERSRVRFPALPDFLRSSGSGTGSTQPREDN
jgi:hypothetical protein